MKRAIDFLAAAFLLVVLSPLTLIIALAVAIDVRLPLTFWQQRPGLNGVPFKLYKFRTMGAAHDDNGNRIPDADRVSIIGEFLRRTHLDELPQLYNVLLGDMSFVGPRPLLWKDMADDPRKRLSVRPGITGWAQVKGIRELPVDDKDALDRWYVRNMSLNLDLGIISETFAVVFRGERLCPTALLAARSEGSRVRRSDVGDREAEERLKKYETGAAV